MRQRDRSVKNLPLNPPLILLLKLVQALVRDGYCCLVTGIYDVQVASDPNINEEIIMAAGGEVYTECAHIVPDPIYLGVLTNTFRKVNQFSFS